MIGIVRLALARPYTFVVGAILIAVFGILAAIRTPTDILPDIGIPVIAAVWTYNGMGPEDMSGRIVYYYERTLTAQVSGISRIESQSLFGYGVVKIFFQPGTNIDAALAQVTAASQTVLKLLPAGVTPPYVLAFNASSVPILQLALSSRTLPQMRLFDQGQSFIRPQLATVPGAAVPSPYGGKVRQIQVDLDQHALQARNLSAQDVVAALADQNLITPVGTQKIGDFEWSIRLNDAPETIAALNALPVKRADGTVVAMRDVAQVRDGSPPQTNVVHVDGTHAVLMTILKAGSASTLDIIAGVKRLLPQIEDSLPPGLKLTTVGDQSAFVRAAVAGVASEGGIAAGLTGLMILVFLGSWRSTVIIAVSIPLAILFSVICLSLLGQTFNVMTLGGLALAVGILVDDATVTIENVNHHLEQGKQVRDAILDGARQIVVPATVSLLCICIVFVPMFMLGGIAGYLFRPLAEAVVCAMAGSYLLSRTLVPTMAAYLLKPHEHEARPPPGAWGRFLRGFERRFEAVRRGYLGILALALAHRGRTIAGFAAVALGSFALLPFLGRDFFPAVESQQIRLHVRAPTGTRIENTSRLVGEVEAAMRRFLSPARVASIVDNIGLPISGINMAYGNSGTIGVQDADILVSLRDTVEPRDLDDLRRMLRERFPEATFSFLPADIVSQILNFGLPAAIDVQVTGRDLAADRDYARMLLQSVRRVPGVVDARIQQPADQPTLNVDVNRDYAELVGLTERNAATSMLATLAGSMQVAPTFWLNPKNGVSYPIVVQTPQYQLASVDALRNIPIAPAASGGRDDIPAQPLGALARIRPGAGSAVVSHYNVRPAIDIYAGVQGRDLGAVAADIEAVLHGAQAALPRGAQAALRGQATVMAEAYAQLLGGLAFAVLLIYLLIVVNFQSWLDPLVIVTALPGALAGIVWMLFLSGTTVSVPALTGAIMCMGVATANGILVISFARERLAEGAGAAEAALAAGAARFRPVVMTALAMIVGMGPTALSAEQNAPLGRAVIGGLLFATVATLVLVPTVFGLVHAATAPGGAVPPRSAMPRAG